MQDDTLKNSDTSKVKRGKGNSAVKLNIQKLFSLDTLALCIIGLGINMALPALVKLCGAPLFLDTVGTILSAALGGGVPGVIVGFLSTIINYSSDPITMYYGILAILIAVVAAQLSRRGAFKSLKGCIVAVICFAVIGGGIGSLMSSVLYGSGIDSGLSAPYAYMLLDAGFPEFWAKLTGDLLVDFPDKALTVALVFLTLRFLPKSLRGRFPLSFFYDYDDEKIARIQAQEHEYYRKRSVNAKIAIIIGFSACVLSVIALTVGILFHHNQLIAELSSTATNTARMGATFLDGDSLERYLIEGPNSPGYTEDKAELENLRDSISEISYLYVYQVRPDGCFVIFDLDTPDVPSSPFGEMLDFDASFLAYKDSLLAGDSIEPVVSNDEYGWLFTSYEPVRNSAGKTVAYVGADLNMEDYVHDLMAYAIQIASILFGVTMIVIALAIWYAMRSISLPIISIISLSHAFDKTPPEKWLESSEWLNREEVHTGDEVEQIYKAVCVSQEHVSHNVKQLIESEERLRNTRAIEKKNRELAQAIKRADEANAAKSAFLSRMSHDLRTPLNGIIGMAEISEDTLCNPEQTERNLGDIKTAGTFMLGLINDILDMSKIESGKVQFAPKPCKMIEITKAISTMFQPRCESKGVVLNTHNDNESVTVIVDKMRLQQIVFNLVSNAVKFTPKGGHVLFDTSYVIKDDEAITTIVVADDGPGMTAEFQSCMYEAFTRENDGINDNIQGTGLGLPITNNLVSLMGGTISCKSAPGSGTSFTVVFTLPLAQATEDGSCEQVLLDYSVLKGRRILLCEDNEVNARITIALLERYDVLLDHASNGQVGLDMMRQSTEAYYDAVLMDIRMPVMDGLTAARNIRALDRVDVATMPIIALTANAFAEDVNASRAAGINEHLAKPIQPDDLYAALVKALG